MLDVWKIHPGYWSGRHPDGLPRREVPETLTKRYNIAPSQAVAVLRNTGTKQVELLRWGLIPPWAKDLAIGNRLINARAELWQKSQPFAQPFVGGAV